MTTGVLPLDDLKHLVTLNTGFFECSAIAEDDQMKVTAGNFDQAGMSAGNLQYNFGDANRLTELFLYMLDNYPQICIDAFGTYTTEYNTWVTAMRGTQTDRVNFGDSISTPLVDPNKKKYIAEPYKSCFANLLLTNECKAEYYAIRDKYYWDLPFDLFRQLSCTSRMALASLFDLYINKGRYYPINLIQWDFEGIDADTTLSEAEKEARKIYQLNQRGNEEENALSDSSSLAFDDRRYAMRDQGGNYYGLTYDPDVQFDMNQEPAITEKSAASLNVKLGDLDIKNAYFGAAPIESIYLGANLVGSAARTPYTTTKAPQTQIRSNAGGWAGIGAATAITLTAGQPLWIDVQNFVACRTYYTIDGTTPTTASPRYTGALTFNASCTLKVLTVSIFGVAEAVKTLAITIAVAPTTTISPSAVVQNNIPITVTLTTSEAGAAIKYRIGSGTTVYSYTAPFQVNQSTAGVLGTAIKITYWSVGASATEAEKSIIYDTSGAIPEKPVATATAGNNQVALSWNPTANTTSYTVLRDGVILTPSQYQTGTTYTDTTAVNGVQYSYVVRAANYGRPTDSDPVLVTPAAPVVAPSGYRYLKIQGYGSAAANDITTRMIEVEAWEGSINRMSGLAATAITWDTPNNTTLPAKTTILDGVKTSAANSYPFWWTTLPNANVIVDLGATRALTKLNYYSFSISTDQRANRFKILGSNTNNGTDWVTLWDMSANTALQPVLPSGYEKVL